jgi:hypothetical protein
MISKSGLEVRVENEGITRTGNDITWFIHEIVQIATFNAANCTATVCMDA